MTDVYDLIIIGAGPAGLTSGIHAVGDGLRTLIVEQGTIGGQTINVELIKNYPGFPDGVSGAELCTSMMTQAMNLGVEIKLEKVIKVELASDTKTVRTESGGYAGRALIIAGGGQPEKLGIPGEDEFTGRGVSYCASCDGGFFKGLQVAIVGGDDIDITLAEGLHLAEVASRVTVIHGCKPPRVNRLLQQGETKIELVWDTVVEKIEGENSVKGIKLRNGTTGQISSLDVVGVFVYAGIAPSTDYLKGILPLDDRGHIIVDSEMRTEVPGVFAAGDIRHNSPRRVSTAVGDGATATISAVKFIEREGR